MRQAVIILVGALAAGAIVAGCGGDDDDNGTTTASLSKEEFIAQGDKICAKANTELDQAGRQFDGPPSKEDLEQFTTKDLTPNIQGQVDALRALGVPEDGDQVTNALDDAESALNELQSDPSQLQGGEAGKQLNEAGNELQEYGFKQCGR